MSVELWVVADGDDPDISGAISSGAAFTEFVQASKRAMADSAHRPMKIYKVVEVAHYRRTNAAPVQSG